MFIYEAWAYKSLNGCDKNLKAINNIFENLLRSLFEYIKLVFFASTEGHFGFNHFN